MMSLVILTGVLSAFLNDVIAILLLVPLSIEIAQTVGIHPFVFVIPEVLASNIGGAADETGRGEEVELEMLLSDPMEGEGNGKATT